MRITAIEWSEESVDHIAGHGVSPGDVEEVCFGRPLIQRARGRKRAALYFARGQTAGGRYLTVVFRYLGGERARVVTARDMTESERQGYRRRSR